LLLDFYGYQGWWPVDEGYHATKCTDPRDEIIIGAVLTQNTSWRCETVAAFRSKIYNCSSA